MSLVLQSFWNDGQDPGGIFTSQVWTSFLVGASWTTKSLYYSCVTAPPTIPAGFNPATMGFEGFSAGPNGDDGVFGALDSTDRFSGEQFYYITGNTSPPPIDNTNNPNPLDYWSLSQGPWRYNGTLWGFGLLFGSAEDNQFAAYKLVGSSWVQQDSAHQPTPAGSIENYATFWDGVSNLVRCVVPVGTNQMALQEFDMNTGLWGATHDPVTLSLHPSGYFNLVRDINGVVYFFYSYTNGHTFVSYLSGGTWTVDVQVDQTIPVWPSGTTALTWSIQAMLDPNGTTIHVPYTAQSTLGRTNASYIAITAPGTFANNHDFGHDQGMDAIGNSWGHSVLYNNSGTWEIRLSLDHQAAKMAGGFYVAPANWVGTPLGAPVWTFNQIDFDENDIATCVYLTVGTPPPAAPEIMLGTDLSTAFSFSSIAPPLSLTCPTGIATVGVAYSSSFVATGGQPPYTFSIVVGSLPPGLTLNPSTGLVSGVPTGYGPYNYTGKVTDANGTTKTVSCTITIPQPTPTVGPGRPIFYSLTFNYIPLTQVQSGRTWDWDELGHRYDKRLYQLIIEYDIPPGQSAIMSLDTITGVAGNQQENTAVQTFTLVPPTSAPTGAPTRLTANFALIDVLIVKKIRIRPTSYNPDAPNMATSNPVYFKYFSYSFGEMEQLPADRVLFTPWSDYGSAYDKYAQQIDLDVDTGGITAMVSLQADDATVAGPFPVTTTSENRKVNLTMPPQVIGKQFRLFNTPGAGVAAKFQLYKHDIIFLPADRGPVFQTFDWSFLDWPYDKYLKHLTIEYDTYNSPTTILIDTMTGLGGGTINVAAESVVLDQTGRALQTFAFPDGIYFKQIRLYPQSDNVVFKEWKPSWDVEKMPPDVTEFTDWVDLGWPCQKILRSLEIEMNTDGVEAIIQIQGDGANLGPPLPITTTINDRRRIISLPSDLIAINFRLVFTPGTNGATQYFNHSFEAIREPCAVDHWDSYESNFGYDGYSWIKQCWAQYICPSPITITFLVEGGQLFYQVTLPAHATRDVERFYLPAFQSVGGTPVLNKAKRHRIQIDSVSPFKYYPDVSRIEWQALGSDQRAGYQQLKLSEITAIDTGFGTIEGTTADSVKPGLVPQV